MRRCERRGNANVRTNAKSYKRRVLVVDNRAQRRARSTKVRPARERGARAPLAITLRRISVEKRRTRATSYECSVPTPSPRKPPGGERPASIANSVVQHQCERRRERTNSRQRQRATSEVRGRGAVSSECVRERVYTRTTASQKSCQPSQRGRREIWEENPHSTDTAQRLRGARAYASPAARAGERGPPQPKSESRVGIERLLVWRLINSARRDLSSK